MKTFGERLKSLRKRKDLTQEDLAKNLNMSKSAISMYENDNRKPDYENLEIFADFFNVDLNYLLGHSEVENKYNYADRIKEEKSNYISIPESFKSAEEAMKFILNQEVLMAYGGYDLDKMSEEEIIDIAENMLFTLRLSLEKRKKKKGE